MKKSEKRQGEYAGIIEEVVLSADPDVEELGKAVIFTFLGSELLYKNHKTEKKESKKEIQLLDGAKLTVILPWDKDFVDSQDAGSAEIYQCYQYISDAGEVLADIFLGIAPELDCDLSEKNIMDSWRNMYGEANDLEIKKVSHNVFSLRAEMKNESIHKISYYETAEDLLLECGLQIYDKNKSEKLAKQFIKWMEQFVSNCKFKE